MKSFLLLFRKANRSLPFPTPPDLEDQSTKLLMTKPEATLTKQVISPGIM